MIRVYQMMLYWRYALRPCSVQACCFIQHLPSLRPELLSYLFGDLLTIGHGQTYPCLLRSLLLALSGAVSILAGANSNCD